MSLKAKKPPLIPQLDCAKRTLSQIILKMSVWYMKLKQNGYDSSLSTTFMWLDYSNQMHFKPHNG